MKLFIVGFGAGSLDGMTIAARRAIEISDVIVGYTTYTELMRKLFPDKRFVSTPMTKESDRVSLALSMAASGQTVSIVCSGDSGVYGMAGLAFQLAVNYPQVDIEVVAGVTAALSGGAVLGAPLTHDFAVVSLSDLLTPWEKIEKRLECAAMADFVIVLYNPSSKKRTDYLKKACKTVLKHRSGDVVCGYVKHIGRAGQESKILSLSQLENEAVDMFTTVFIGTDETKIIGDKMVTPRGYKNV